MNEHSWHCEELSLSIHFNAYDSVTLLEEKITIQPWHQAPPIPEKNIRASMLQFLVGKPKPDELTFLPVILQSYDAIVKRFISYLKPLSLKLRVVLGVAAPFGFYSQNPMGFDENEIEKLGQEIHQFPRKSPNLKQLGLKGTVVDVLKLKSVPPVFERVSVFQNQEEQFMILGIHEQSPDQVLAALLGRFFHGLGHNLIAERVIGEKNEKLAQSWAKAIIKEIRDYSHKHPCTLGQLSDQTVDFFPESASLTIERLCQAAIPAVFTGELFEQQNFFKLLEEMKGKL